MTRTASLSASIALATVLLVPAIAPAADVMAPGKVSIIKPGTLAKFVAKPVSPATFTLPAPNSAGDPTTAGAGGGSGSLQVFDTVLVGAGENTYALPAANWKGLGNPAGSSGYKYKGAGTPGDPCKIVLVKEKVIKAVCKGADVSFALPMVGNEAIVLSIGATPDRYCAEFGGTLVKNE